MDVPTRNLTLLLFGVAIGVSAFSGDYLNFVRPIMFWILTGSAAVIIFLAITGVIEDVSSVAHPGGDVADGRLPAVGPAPADHDHSHGSSRAGWLVLVPVLLLMFCTPPALDPGYIPSSINPAARAPEDARKAFPPLPDGDAPAISLHDFQNRAIDDSAGTLNREVTITAYVVRRDAQVLLARMMIWCCVADARPIQIEARNGPLLPPDGTWVTAVVRLVPGSATPQRHYRPIADLISYRAVSAPSPPYDT